MRPTAKELLSNPIFNDMRIAENEIQAMHKISIEIDKEHPIDYEEQNGHNVGHKELMDEIKIDIIKESFRFPKFKCSNLVQDNSTVDLSSKTHFEDDLQAKSMKSHNKHTQRNLFEKRNKLMKNKT